MMLVCMLGTMGLRLCTYGCFSIIGSNPPRTGALGPVQPAAAAVFWADRILAILAGIDGAGGVASLVVLGVADGIMPA